MRFLSTAAGLVALAATGLAGPVASCDPSTVVSTITETVTACPSSTTQSYFFQVSSGSTIWIGSNTPASTDSFTVGGTETLTMVPVVPTPTSATSTIYITHIVPATSTIATTLESPSSTTTTTASQTIIYSSTVYVTMTSSASGTSASDLASSSSDGLTTTLHYTSTVTERETTTLILSSSSAHETVSTSTETAIYTTPAAGTFGGWNATATVASSSVGAGSIYSNSTATSLSHSRVSSHISAHISTPAHGSGYPGVVGANSTMSTTCTEGNMTRHTVTGTTPTISVTVTPTVVTYPGGFSLVSNGIANGTSTKSLETSYSIPRTPSVFSSVSIPRKPSVPTSVPTPSMTGVATPSANGTISTIASKTSSSAVSSSAAASAVCDASIEGELGNFTITWDDEPDWNPSSNYTYIFPPVFSPYHDLFFSNGFAYVPAPYEPFKAVSAPRLAIFLPNLTTPADVNIRRGDLPPGAIGSGSEATNSAFWFDAYGTYAACDNKGPAPCNFTVEGYRWDEEKQTEVAVAVQKQTIAPCPAEGDCNLTEIVFSDAFRNLSMILFDARYNDPVAYTNSSDIFLLDNLQLGWVNNSCEAGGERVNFGA